MSTDGNLFFTCLAGAIGLLMAARCRAGSGRGRPVAYDYRPLRMKTSFWPLRWTFMSGTAAAAAIADINSHGNFGLIGPDAVAWFSSGEGRC